MSKSRDYTYAELCRMTKKRVMRIAGYKNLKSMHKDNVFKNLHPTCVEIKNKRCVKFTKVDSKKSIAKMIASDR